MENNIEGSSSRRVKSAMTMANQVKFQVIVDLPRNKNIEHYLVMPPVFRNQLEKKCNGITVIDSRGREYPVFVYGLEDGFVKIGHASWPLFASTNIVVDLDISKLCFKLLAKNVFEVICFDSYGMEKMRGRGGRLVVKRCLVQASESAVHEEYLPPPILEDMNRESCLKPDWEAELIGPKQNGKAEVIYHFHEDNDDLKKWCAVGLKGDSWTNFIMMNDVDEDFIMLFTSMGEQRYVVDVFNQKGVGLGLIDSSIEARLFQEEGVEVYSDDEDNDREFLHECRVKKHKHKKVRYPYFLVRLREVSLTHKMVTVPKYFVRQYNLQVYEEAVIFYGHLEFKARLDIKRDARVPDDLTHMVIVRDWSFFMKHSGFMIGEPMKFEFNEKKSVDRGKAQFYVC